LGNFILSKLESGWCLPGLQEPCRHIKGLEGEGQAGGLVLVGEPFWRNEPDPEYQKLTGYNRELCGSHAANVKTGENLGLSFFYSLVSN
jgi:hypothetical protein